MANILLTSDWHWTDKPSDKYRFGIVDWIIDNAMFSSNNER